jgi:hypothetical protein
MIGAEGFFANLERAPDQRLSGGRLPLRLIHPSHIVKGRAHLLMIGPKSLFAGVDSPFR